VSSVASPLGQLGFDTDFRAKAIAAAAREPAAPVAGCA